MGEACRLQNTGVLKQVSVEHILWAPKGKVHICGYSGAYDNPIWVLAPSGFSSGFKKAISKRTRTPDSHSLRGATQS